MTEPDFSRLSRPVHPIPDFVRTALEQSGLWEAYRARPPHQQNDYIGWITRAKRSDTKLRRLRQMLDELRAGDTYMNMPYPARDWFHSVVHTPLPGESMHRPARTRKGPPTAWTDETHRASSRGQCEEGADGSPLRH